MNKWQTYPFVVAIIFLSITVVSVIFIIPIFIQTFSENNNQIDSVRETADSEVFEIFMQIIDWKNSQVKMGVSRYSICRTITFEKIGFTSGNTAVSPRIAPEGALETSIAIYTIEFNEELKIPIVYGDIYGESGSTILMYITAPLFTNCVDDIERSTSVVSFNRQPHSLPTNV